MHQKNKGLQGAGLASRELWEQQPLAVPASPGESPELLEPSRGFATRSGGFGLRSAAVRAATNHLGHTGAFQPPFSLATSNTACGRTLCATA